MNGNRSNFSESHFEAASPPPRQSRVKPWIVALAATGGALLLGLVACGGLLYVGATGISRRPPTDEERLAVVTIDDLASFGVEPVNQPQREVWQVKRNFDGTLEIEYDYDPERAPGSRDDVTLMSSVDIEHTESSARETFGVTVSAYQLGFRVSGATSRQQPHTMSGADQSHFALMLKDGKPVGNMAVVQQGKRIHGLLLVGIYFDDPVQVERLLRPSILSSATLSTR